MPVQRQQAPRLRARSYERLQLVEVDDGVRFSSKINFLFTPSTETDLTCRTW